MGKVMLNFPKPYPRQQEFLACENRFINYGGARGGGKSAAARIKCSLLALYYPGIQILLLRRTYGELRGNHIVPLLQLLHGVAEWNEQAKEFRFPNGSRIVLGYCRSEKDVLQYQGQSYDVIFLEEATQFTEFQHDCFLECNRSSGSCKKKFRPRMYYTCNPGGVGHAWVKRLFIDRDYRPTERPEQYTFISAQVYDNAYIMENSPDYVRMLENLPESRRRAMLHGDWDVFEGQFFPEFSRELHVCEAFPIPPHWRTYVALDYGQDALAAYRIAVDERGCAYVVSEVFQSDLIVSEAAKAVKQLGPVDVWLAPPDLWSREQGTGHQKADIFWEHGVVLTKASSDRVTGWAYVREYLKAYKTDEGNVKARLQIFTNCLRLIESLPQLIYDPKRAGDASTEPHKFTHAPDALRYFCISNVLPGIMPETHSVANWSFEKRKPVEDRLGKGAKTNVF